MRKIEFSVKDMERASDARVIIDKLTELEDVADVKLDRDRTKIAVDFENHKICDSEITCAVEELGYRVHTV